MGVVVFVNGYLMLTFRKASFTRSSVIRPFRHSWFTRSSLDVPELIQAILVVLLDLLLVPAASEVVLFLLPAGRSGLAAAARRKRQARCLSGEATITAGLRGYHERR